MSGDSHLIKMVCDIARFFATEPDESEAIYGIVNHIEKFWSPRMRHKLIASSPGLGAEIPTIVRAALKQLAQDRQAEQG